MRARAPTFDRDAARQAWRQVARARGGGPGLGLGPRRSSAWPYWLVAVGVVVAVGYAWYPRPEAPAPSQQLAAVAAAHATAEPAPTVNAPLRPPAAPETPATVGSAAPTEDTMGTVARAEAPRRRKRSARRGRRRPAAATKRRVPAGTTDDHAEAFRKLPHGRGDGTPLSGIGSEGVHVDRLTIGTKAQLSRCTGESKNFSARRDDMVHACIRVVHRRLPQRVMVRWERDGHLVRRQWLPIPDVHAFRTRASMPVRDRFRGDWEVRVLSDDGVELATHAFHIKD